MTPLNEPDLSICTITLIETPDDTIAIQTKWDPPIPEWRQATGALTPLMEAAAVAIGAVANWSANEITGHEPDEGSTE